jgi:ferrous iron transport protein A
MIKKIGGNPAVKKHLENLGFTAGGFVTVICKNKGNLIVGVRESRIAVSCEMASRIMV